MTIIEIKKGMKLIVSSEYDVWFVKSTGFKASGIHSNEIGTAADGSVYYFDGEWRMRVSQQGIVAPIPIRFLTPVHDFLGIL